MRHLASAALVSFLLSLAQPASAHVVVSELLWAGSALSTSDEWVELACVPDAEDPVCGADVSGWTLSYLGSSGQEAVMARFAPGTVVGTGGYIVSNFAATQSVLLEEPDLVTPDVSLPNSKLKLWLRDETGLLIDEVDDGVGTPFAGANPSSGPKASMERIDPFVSGADSTNWRTSTGALGVDPGAAMQCTAGWIEKSWYRTEEETEESEEAEDASSASSDSLASSVLSSLDSSVSSVSSQGQSSVSSLSVSVIIPPIRFTEVLADPVGRDDDEWVEIANLGSGSVRIGGWTLQAGAKSFTIPHDDGYILWPGRRLALHKPLTGLELPNAGGDLRLLSGSLLVDAWTYVGFKEGVSASRSGSDIVPLCTPTPDALDVRVPPDVWIAVQSGEPSGEVPLSINVELRDADGPAAGLTCVADFGDGTVSQGCNPPSHKYGLPSAYTLTITATDYCGVTAGRTLEIRAVKTAAPPPSPPPAVAGVSIVSAQEAECTPSAGADVRISELLPDPDGDDAQEWIELVNAGKADADLCGWSLRDAGGMSYRLDGETIAAGGFLLVQRTDSRIALNNDADTVTLLDSDGGIAHEVTYEKSASGTGYAEVGGIFVWTVPTPGTRNVGPEEGIVSSSAASKILLLESGALLEEDASGWADAAVILSEASPAGGTGKEWVELFNAGDVPASLKGWMLDDIADGGSKPQALDAIVIAPGQFLVVSGSLLKIALNDAGDDLRLLTPDGVREAVTLGPIKAGTSWARVDDGSACVTAKLTPGAANECAAVAVKKPAAKKAVSKAKPKTSAKKSSVGLKTVYKPAASGAVAGIDPSLYADLRDAALSPQLPAPAPSLVGWRAAVILLVLLLVATWAFVYQEPLLKLWKRWRE